MTIFKDTFSMAELSTATESNTQTLKTWLHKGYNVSGAGKIEGGGGRGQRRRFSFYSLMEFAVAAEAAKSGLPLAACFKMAQGFAHVGDGEIPQRRERFPGLPFPSGHAIVFYDQTWGDYPSIVHENYSEITKIPNELGGRPYQMHMVDAGAVFGRVCSRLQCDPKDVLKEAYAANE